MKSRYYYLSRFRPTHSLQISDKSSVGVFLNFVSKFLGIFCYLHKTTMNIHLFKYLKLSLIFLAVIFLSSVTYAASSNNVSIMYGWNGTSFTPVTLTSTGAIMTDINMSESIGLNPKTNNTYDIGGAALLWANLYARTIRSGGFLSIVGDTNVTGTFYASSIVANLENSTGLTNVSLNYGYNGTNFVPLLTSPEGLLRLTVDQASADNASSLGTGATGSDLTLSDRLNVTGTTANSTFSGDVRIFGTLYGGSPVKVAGLNVTDGNLFVTGAIVANGKTLGSDTTGPWQSFRGLHLRTGEQGNSATTVVMLHADEIIT